MKLLYLAVDGYPGDTEPAAAARALVQSARLGGLAVEVVSAIRPEAAGWLRASGLAMVEHGGDSATGLPAHLRLEVDGVPVTLPRESGEAGQQAMLRLFEIALTRSMPDVVIVQGGESAARAALNRARSRGVTTAVALDDLRARDPAAFEAADAVLVPSRFAADYHAEALGLRCSMVPALVDPVRAIAAHPEPRYVTFVDPSAENGAYLFARIADELGRLRPDIPLLIVGARGSGTTLMACGLDVFARGNVALMERTSSPRDHWAVTRLALLPTLAWDASPRMAAEALCNGIPAIASDLGSLPEILGGTGASIAPPGRITPATRALATAEEAAPWVEAIVRLWDDSEAYAEHRRRSLDEARRWVTAGPDSPLATCLRQLRPGSTSRVASPSGRSRAVVLVPFYSAIERPCEQSLRKLEEAGVRVVRSEGCPQIDVARNMMASDALNQGAESLLFIDADLGFDPLDALRLLARPEPVISGVYAKKRLRALASLFADGTTEIMFGVGAPGPYPLKYAAGGFLRIKAEVLRRMIDELNLPACNTAWGRRDWPFFLPIVANQPDGRFHYLGEDWAFSHRLGQIGVTPLADTTIRLWHHGPYAYGWEDAGADPPRHATFLIKIEGS